MQMIGSPTFNSPTPVGQFASYVVCQSHLFNIAALPGALKLSDSSVVQLGNATLIPHSSKHALPLYMYTCNIYIYTHTCTCTCILCHQRSPTLTVLIAPLFAASTQGNGCAHHVPRRWYCGVNASWWSHAAVLGIHFLIQQRVRRSPQLKSLPCQCLEARQCVMTCYFSNCKKCWAPVVSMSLSAHLLEQTLVSVSRCS